ncbi:hypothetical protein BZG02_08315 [Labilibaculum filiforme]|uniref:Uncharacterized protein n=1 Tax=Labilibaculum filiforme TaxID=1940526 RepID=A0A2N3HZ85_9BACT|nr:hypothetical protein [Labilibaculum filiforme]PKQ63380.1 hypothetical protein BZG02_08315 [Labilibaculum filiforme]
MIIEAPEMVLELRATVDSNGRMEYKFSNYFASPEDLKALGKATRKLAICHLLSKNGFCF